MPGQQLTDFLRAASENEKASAKTHSLLLEVLSGVNEAANELVQTTMPKGPLGSLLLVNAHAAFLAAVRVALSGQSPPTFSVLRGALESALYALIASQSEGNATIWLERDKDRARCRRMFTADSGLRILASIDPNLATLMREMYESMIDLGGHPNRDSLIHHLAIDRSNPAQTYVHLTLLESPESSSVARALAACFECGAVILFIAPHVLPGHEPAIAAHMQARRLHNRFGQWLKERGLPPAFEESD